jgi:hypothetical protein
MLGDEMIDEASRKMATQFFLRGQAAGLTATPQAPQPATATAAAAAAS